MPYITKKRREVLESQLNDLDALMWKNTGELNYVITSIINRYLPQKDTRHYFNFNDVIGVLECVKQEFYRRVVIPYEERQREVNGDVY